jgi:hypothetical protein
MKRTRPMIQIALIMMMLTSSVIQAQNLLTVTLTNGQTDSFNVSDIRSLKFVNNTMNLTENDGTLSSWDILDISEYAFNDVISTVETADSTRNQSKIYPNPVSDELTVEYWSSHESKINIELLDLSGKLVRSVFDGINQGKQTYTWTKDLPSGYYLCRIESATKCITKPLIIL